MKSFLLIGLGRFGRHIAEKLNELGHEVMAVDKSEERVNDVMDMVTNAQIGNSTNKDFLTSLGIDNYDVCIVTISNDFQSSLETTYLLKELGAKYIVSRAELDMQAKFLLSNGANDIVYPEKQIADWTAIKYSSEHILDYIKIDGRYSIFEVSPPDAWIGMSIAQLDIRKKYQMNIMVIKKSGEMYPPVTPDTILTRDMTLIVLADNKSLKKHFHI